LKRVAAIPARRVSVSDVRSPAPEFVPDFGEAVLAGQHGCAGSFGYRRNPIRSGLVFAEVEIRDEPVSFARASWRYWFRLHPAPFL